MFVFEEINCFILWDNFGLYNAERFYQCTVVYSFYKMKVRLVKEANNLPIIAIFVLDHLPPSLFWKLFQYDNQCLRSQHRALGNPWCRWLIRCQDQRLQFIQLWPSASKYGDWRLITWTWWLFKLSLEYAHIHT